jgi:hypothetical protein
MSFKTTTQMMLIFKANGEAFDENNHLSDITFRTGYCLWTVTRGFAVWQSAYKNFFK